MAESLDFKIHCPVDGCSGTASFYADKRKKLFLDCDCCGRQPFNRNGGQALLKMKLEKARSENNTIDGVIFESEPEPQPEKNSENSEQNPEDKPEKSGRGFWWLSLVGVLGGGAWLLKKKI